MTGVLADFLAVVGGARLVDDPPARDVVEAWVPAQALAVNPAIGPAVGPADADPEAAHRRPLDRMGDLRRHFRQRGRWYRQNGAEPDRASVIDWPDDWFGPCQPGEARILRRVWQAVLHCGVVDALRGDDEGWIKTIGFLEVCEWAGLGDPVGMRNRLLVVLANPSERRRVHNAMTKAKPQPIGAVPGDGRPQGGGP